MGRRSVPHLALFIATMGSYISYLRMVDFSISSWEYDGMKLGNGFQARLGGKLGTSG